MRSVLVTLLLATTAFAQVDCSNPDNLCTGDPCTISAKIEVATPCVVDFGSRALVVTGIVRVRSDLVGGIGTISWTAASITVPGVIRASDDDVSAGLFGGDVTLTADTDITVDGQIQSDGYFAGVIVLDGGGDVRVRGPIRALGNAAGGNVTVDAGGAVEITRPIKVNAYGLGGIIGVTAGGDLLVDGLLSARCRGSGFVAGGDVTLVAGGTIVIRKPITASAPKATAGSIVVRGAAGVTVERPIQTRGVNGGTVEVSSTGGDVTVANRIDAGALYQGNVIRLEAAGTLLVTGSLLARGLRFKGGDIFAQGATVSLDAANFDVRGGEGLPGGTIEATATGNLTANGTFRAIPNGCIALAAGGTLDTDAATFAPPLVPDCPGSPSGAFLD